MTDRALPQSGPVAVPVAVAGKKVMERLVLSVGGHRVILDATELSAVSPSPLTVKFREVNVCDGGQVKKMLVLCSEPY